MGQTPPGNNPAGRGRAADPNATRVELPSFAAEQDEEEPERKGPGATRVELPSFTEEAVAEDTRGQATRVELPSYAAEGDAPAAPPAPRPAPMPLPAAPKMPPRGPAIRSGPPPSASPKAPAKPEIPGYEVGNKLGSGAMGEVYDGKQLSSGRRVAVKVLSPEFACNREYIERFYREAAAAVRLEHPNIVEGIDCGEASGLHYFVMEFVTGESLEARLKREKKIPERDAIEYAIAVASALECAAREQIVHRDLKPANILITKEGGVKVVDLGLAKQVGGKQSGPQLTRVGIIMGSPYYLAPEQAATQPLDARTDLYCLGATLFHLVTGRVPFEGDDPIEIIEQVISAPPPDARLKNPKVSAGLAKVIQKLMAKKREDRYQTPRELREALEKIRRGGLLAWIARLFGRR